MQNKTRGPFKTILYVTSICIIFLGLYNITTLLNRPLHAQTTSQFEVVEHSDATFTTVYRLMDGKNMCYIVSSGGGVSGKSADITCKIN